MLPQKETILYYLYDAILIQNISYCICHHNERVDFETSYNTETQFITEEREKKKKTWSLLRKKILNK